MQYLLYVLYVILAIVGIKVAGILILFLTTFISSQFISTKKEYNTDSKFYRFLLVHTTAVGMRIMRVRYDLQDFDKIPEGSFPGRSLQSTTRLSSRRKRTSTYLSTVASSAVCA